MKNREELLLEIMHHMASRFKDRLVLEGGMLLRLLNSHRSTQDVDYVLISTESKKALVNEIKSSLKEMSDATIEDVQVNSRGIFVTMVHRETSELRVLVEINVVPCLNLPQEHLSTVALSNKYALSGRVVSTMALPEAFANKIAAALERDSLRDLYDLNLFEGLCEFDVVTLKQRLSRLSVARKKPRVVSFDQAACMLEEKMKGINEETVRVALAPLLPRGESTGIEKIITASLLRIIKRMKTLCDKSFQSGKS